MIVWIIGVTCFMGGFVVALCIVVATQECSCHKEDPEP